MNKIFRVIWSHTTQSWVAVSELTKAHKKAGKAKKLIINSIVAASMMAAGQAMAATAISGESMVFNVNSAQPNGGTAIGDGAVARGGAGGVSIGRNAGINTDINAAQNIITIGQHSRAGWDGKANVDSSPGRAGELNRGVGQAIAIGGGNEPNEGAWAEGDQSISIGSNTHARGDSSIAIGGDDVDKVREKRITYTDKDGNPKTDTINQAMQDLANVDMWSPSRWSNTTADGAAVAIGIKAVASDLSLALGSLARAEKVNTVAIGSGARAELDNSVAIGGGARANSASAGTIQKGTKIGTLEYKFSGGENTLPGDIVSFGTVGFERQLKNVAAGEVSQTSRDAINGSQLFGILNTLVSHNFLKYAGDDAQAGQADAAKKVVKQSLDNNQLNLLGGADTSTLVDNNIGVVYEKGNNIDTNGNDISPTIDVQKTVDGKQVTVQEPNPAYQQGALKIKLAKDLKDLNSAAFKNAAGDATTINTDGVSITPNGQTNPVISLTKDGLNNGGKKITNVEGNLEATQNSTVENSTPATSNATKFKTAPTNVTNTNAATVGDVLNAGWNLQGNGNAVDFVKPYDTVNFADGNGTTVSVESADGKTSTVKYNINAGEGLELTTDNKVKAKAGNGITVDNSGISVKADGNTINIGENGIKVNTSNNVENDAATPGKVKVATNDTGKIATIDSVVDAINKSGFTLKTSAGIAADNLTENGTLKTNGDLINSGDIVEMAAGKNLTVKQEANGKVTFATKDEVAFNKVSVGDVVIDQTNGINAGNKVISNLKDGVANTDAVNVSQLNKLGNNTIKLSAQNESEAATSTNTQALNKDNGINFTVKSANKGLLTAEASGSTITLTPKTAKIGQASTTIGGATTYVDGDGKVNVPTTDGLATAQDVANAINASGWKVGKNNKAEVDTINSGDQVNFINGNATTATVEQDTTAGNVNVKYDVTTGNGLEISNGAVVAKAGNGVTVDNNGINVNAGNGLHIDGNQVKVKTNGNTIVSDADGIKVNTSSNVESDTAAPGKVKIANGDTNKIATIDSVVDAVNKAAWVAKATGNGVAANDKSDNVTAGTEVTFDAGKNIEITHTENKFSFKTSDTPTFTSVQFGDNGPKISADGNNIKVGDKDGNATKITNVANGTNANDAVNFSQLDAVSKQSWKIEGSADGGTYNKDTSTENAEQAVSKDNKVGLKAGKNIVLNQKDKDFTYALNGELSDLKSAEFKETGKATTKITSDGITIKPAAPTDGSEQKPDVSLTENGLNNGGNNITNVKGNLPDTKNGAAGVATTNKSAPATSGADAVNINNAATVGDILNSGWNIQEKGTAKDFVKAYDTVNFDNGTGTTASVAVSDDGKTSTVKYSVDTTTLTNDAAANAGKVKAGDSGNKFATATDVASAINSAYWKAAAAGNGAENDTADNVTAGTTVTFEAGKNLKVTHTANNFKFETSDTPEFKTISLKDGDNKVVNFTPTENGLSFSKADNAPINITGVTSGLDNHTSGSANGLRDLNKTTTGTNTPVVSDNTAATVGDLRNMGWVVSSNKTTGTTAGTVTDTAYNAQVKNANEVEFVGTGIAKVSGKTDGEKRVITVHVDEPKTVQSPIVYTKADGTKVVQGDDGEFYEVDENGQPDTNKKVEKDQVIASLNNGNNSTTAKPMDLGNVRSTIGWNKDGETPNGDQGKTTAITADVAKTATTSLLSKTGNDLNKVATVGDLQAVAQAGLDFNGNTLTEKEENSVGKDIHKALGNKLIIKGEGTDNQDTFASASGNIQVASQTGELVVKLNKELQNLKSAEFKEDGKPTTKITNEGVTITPNGQTTPTVSLTENGLNNGGNNITNVAGNLPETRNVADAADAANKPKTDKQDAPTNVQTNNAATVGDILNAGWNIKENTTDKDFVKAYDTVSFSNGTGTTASVAVSDDGKTSTVKYNVNAGDGIEIDTTAGNNKVKAKAGNGITVDSNGISVNPDGSTITVGTAGIKVNTSKNAESDTTVPGKVKVEDGETGKVATIDSVVDAVNKAGFTLKASANGGTLNTGSVDANGELITPGKVVELRAGKNLTVQHDTDGKITYSTVDTPEFKGVTLKDGNNQVNVTPTANGLNLSKPKAGSTTNETEPVKITGVAAGDISDDSTDAINGSQFNKLASNTIKLQGQNGDETATSTQTQALNKDGGIVFTVKSANKGLLTVAASGDAITLTPVTASIGTKGTDNKVTYVDGNGKVNVPTTDGLATATDVANAINSAAWKAAASGNGVTNDTADNVTAGSTVTFDAGKNIVIDHSTPNKFSFKTSDTPIFTNVQFGDNGPKISANSGDLKVEKADGSAAKITNVATGTDANDAVNVAQLNAVAAQSWKIEGSANGGTYNKDKDTAASEQTVGKDDKVGLKAGKNIVLDQKDRDFTYSLSKTLSDLTSAEFKKDGANEPSTKIDNSGITITPTSKDDKGNTKAPVSLTENGLNNGGNNITNVKGNLPNTVNGAAGTATTKQDAPATGTAAGQVNTSNAATVGDILNAGWNIQNNTTAKDFVKAYDTVNFADGTGTTASVEVSADGTTSTVKYNVNLGNGLEMDGNNIKANAGNGVTVDGTGINVNTGKGLKIDTANGNKVAVDTDGTTITTDADGKVKAVTGTTEVITAANKTGNEKAGQVKPSTGSKDKLATVEAVANAVNSAKWYALAKNDDTALAAGDETADTSVIAQAMGAGDELTLTAGKNLRVKRTGANFTFATVENPEFKELSLKDGNNQVKVAPTDKGLSLSKGDKDNSPVNITGVTSGLTNYTDADNSNVPARNNLINLGAPNAAGAVSNNTAATVGDLRNMGWVISSNKTTDSLGTEYSDVVKNANEVKFVGTGLATVSGKTDNGVRTITVDVNAQNITNSSVTPVEYTKADGTKVYPQAVKNADGTTTVKFFPNPDGTGTEVPANEVITSVNGPNGTTNPTTLANVEGNLNGAKTNTNAPTTSAAAPNTTDATKDGYVNTHNAATVGDVLNAGWNLQGNGQAVDFVKPFDTVNFVDGKGTTVTTSTDGTTSIVSVNIDNGTITAADDGTVKAADVAKLTKDVTDAEAELSRVKADTASTPEQIKTAEDAVKTAQEALNKANNQVATTQNVTDMINAAAWIATSATEGSGKAADGNTTSEEKVQAGNKVTFKAGDNLKIKQAGKDFTYSLNPELSGLTSAEFKAGDDKPSTKLTNDGITITPAAKDATGNANTKTPVSLTENGLDNGGNNITNVAGNLDGAKANTTAPTTSAAAPNTSGTGDNQVNTNNAATVGDVLNAGWNLQNNGTAKDFVRPFDTVNFVDGKGTTALVTTNDGKTSSDVTFNVKAANASITVGDDGVKVTTGEITNNTDGSVKGPKTAAEAKALKDALTNAQNELETAKAAAEAAKKALDADKDNETLKQDLATKEAELATKQTDLNNAQTAFDNAGGNQIATVQNVADAINNSFWTATSAATANGEVSGTSNEKVNPGDKVTFEADKNIKITQDAGKFTFATKENVEFTTVKVGAPETYKDANGEEVVKVGDKFYKAADVVNGTPKDDAVALTDEEAAKVTTDNNPQVNFVRKDATKASNNATDKDGNVVNPTTALDISSTDGKPTQLTGVGSVLNTGKVETAPAGKDGTNKPQIDLVNLGIDPATGKDSSTKLTSEQLNSAATVRDLANMGWVVKASDNGYVDTVKNANQVDFVGKGFAKVSGETVDGVRKITVSVQTGEVLKDTEFKAPDGTKLVKIGDNYYSQDDIDPATGEPKADVKPKYKAVDGKVLAVNPTGGATSGDNVVLTNNNAGVVTGKQVAEALQQSGWNVGLADADKAVTAFGNGGKALSATELEKVNPNDNVRFANGNNTVVKASTVTDIDANGNKVTNTYIRTDINGLPIQYTNASGAPVTKVGDKFFTVDENGNPTATEVPAGDLIANVINPAAKPNTKGDATTLGNVKNNLPTVNDETKEAKDADGNALTTGNTAAPLSPEEAAEIAQSSKGNNAATVSDVLNAGWNLQENGEAKDFVKPYDTVNFVNGANTEVTVTNTENGAVNDIQVNVKGLPITYTTKVDGKDVPVAKVGDEFYLVDEDGKPIIKDGNGNALEPVDAKDIATNLANPTAKPNEIGSATQLGNVANGASTFTAPKDAAGNELVKANDGNWYKAGDVNANGTTVEDAKPATPAANSDPKAGLVDFANSNANNAATVGDLQNMGWVVSASDNDYNDQVRNTNKVDFKGGNGIEVKGETLADGTRQLTVGIKEGSVTNRVEITKEDGSKVDAVVIDGKYYERGTDGKPTNEITLGDKDTVSSNAGSGFVTGNTVANAINESGWNVGLADQAKADTAFADSTKALSADKLEKVNPDDNVRFADGKNTKVKAATVDEVNKDGKKVTNTYVKVNVDLPMSQISAVDAAGNKVVKDEDGNWYPAKADGTADKAQAKVDPTTVRQSTSLDPDGLGDKYSSTTNRSANLTPAQLGELVGKQTVAADKAAENVVKLLEGQPQAVVNAAKDAARKAAEDEVKAQYLKDNGLDTGTGGTVITNVAWGKAPSDAVNVDQLQNSGWNVDSRQVEGSNGKVISGNTAPTKVRMDETVNVDAGNNIEITRNGRDIAIATSMDPTFNTVKIGTGDNAVNLSNNNGALDVGGAKITNVAPGDISANSTDAVNGAQIYALAGNQTNVNSQNTKYDKLTYDENGNPTYITVNAPNGRTVVTDKVTVTENGKEVTKDAPMLRTYNVHGQKEIVTNNVLEAVYNMNEQGIKFFHSNDGVNRPKVDADNNYDSSASGKFATAIGSRADASGENAVALGYGAKATGKDSIAIGTGNQVHASNSGAFGDPNIISGTTVDNVAVNGSYAIGNNNIINSSNTFVLGNDVNNKGNSTAMGSTVESSVYLGNKSTATAGDGSRTATLKNRKQDGSEGATTTAGSKGTVSTATVGNMTYGGFAGATADGVVSVGAAGNERRVQNVAAGEISATSTDAINGSQLHSVAAGMNARMGDLNNHINKVGKRADAGTASALATAQLPQAYIPGKSMIAAAGGNYQGQSGIALGMSRISDNGKVIIRLSGTANTQGKKGIAAGIGYQW